MAVQEVDQSNDIGKDLYVDLAESDGRFTGELIALQIKSGEKYRRAEGYAIPSMRPLPRWWRDSTFPVFGIVHDPAEDALFWVNLTQWSREQARYELPLPATIKVSESDTLSAARLDRFIAAARAAILASAQAGGFGLAGGMRGEQLSAISDLFALGRRSAAPLLLVRSSLKDLHTDAFDAALGVLACCVNRRDIACRQRTGSSPTWPRVYGAA